MFVTRVLTGKERENLMIYYNMLPIIKGQFVAGF